MSSGSVRLGAQSALGRAFGNEFVRHSALVFGATMAVNVFNYAFNFALSRRLGVEGFATLSALISFILIFSIPASILTLIVVKYTATFHAAGDAPRVRRLSLLLLKWTTAAACFVFIAGVLLQSQIGLFLRVSNVAAMPSAVGILALSFITPTVRGVLQGEQDFSRYSISVVLESFLKVLVCLAFAYAGAGIVGVMAGWLLAALCALGYTVWAVLNKHGAAVRPSVRLAIDARRLIQTTTGVGFANASIVVLSFMDVLLVKHYFDPHQAGLYAAVNLTGKIVLFLGAFLPAVLLPKAVAKTTRGEDSRMLLLQATVLTVALSGGVLSLFSAMPAVVIRILAGADFVAASPYVMQYDGAMCMLAILTLLVNYRIGVHRFGFVYPLGAILSAELIAIAVFHRTLWDVIHILLGGHALAVIACAIGTLPKRPMSGSDGHVIDMPCEAEGLTGARGANRLVLDSSWKAALD